jgi:hypothetical protein
MCVLCVTTSSPSRLSLYPVLSFVRTTYSACRLLYIALYMDIKKFMVGKTLYSAVLAFVKNGQALFEVFI